MDVRPDGEPVSAGTRNVKPGDIVEAADGHRYEIVAVEREPEQALSGRYAVRDTVSEEVTYNFPGYLFKPPA